MQLNSGVRRQHVLDSDTLSSGFLRYLGPADLHDARVVSVDLRGNGARVTVESYEGRRFALEFSDVASVDARKPIGMVLYALMEVAASPPVRRFEFAASDEESGAGLIIEARDVAVVDDGTLPRPGV